MEDGRCRLGLGGRRELVRLIEDGQSLRAAARRLGVAPATAHRWWHRWAGAPEPERSSGACLQSRPPRPRSCPWQLGPEEERAILTARERTNLGPARLAGLVGRRRSTIWKVLHRHGVSRRRRSPRPAHPRRRYEWSEPGALLHIDTKQLARFARPGHFRPRVLRGPLHGTGDHPARAARRPDRRQAPQRARRLPRLRRRRRAHPLASSSVAATRQTPQIAVARRPLHPAPPIEVDRMFQPAVPVAKSSRVTTASTSCQRSSGGSCGDRPDQSPVRQPHGYPIGAFLFWKVGTERAAQLRRARRLGSPSAPANPEAGSDATHPRGRAEDHGVGHGRLRSSRPA